MLQDSKTRDVSAAQQAKLFPTLEDLSRSDFLFRIQDAGADVLDRITVVFCDGSYLALSLTGAGFSMWGEIIDPLVMSEKAEEGDSVDLVLGDLTPELQLHILYRVNEAFQERLDDFQALKPGLVARGRRAAEVHEGLYNSAGKGIYIDSVGGFNIRLEGAAADDRGPFSTVKEAFLMTLPEAYSFSGPEYHSPLEVSSLTPTKLEPPTSEMSAAAGPRFSIGLTGGIGCGKTTVANIFAELGASLVDTDEIAHSLTGPQGAAMPAIIEQFGSDFATIDGALDRTRMRDLVFSDPVAKKRLEAILHPRIRQAVLEAAEVVTGSYVIFVVPLLIESGAWRERVSHVLAIDCPEEIQVARVMARNNLSEDQVRAIMDTQVTRAERLAAADDVIINAADIAQLRPQIETLHAKYMQEASNFKRGLLG